MEKSINELLNISLENINELIDSSKIIGSPIIIDEKRMLIPITKVIYGFGTGGSEFGIKKEKNTNNNLLFESSNETYPFGGGTLGGITMTPEAFLYLNDDKVDLIRVKKDEDVLSMIFSVIKEKIKK